MPASTNAYAYGYELITITSPTSVRSGHSFGYENVMIPTPVKSRNGYAYGYENVSNNANPTQLKVWDGVQWVRKPYYVWNGSAWVQIT